MRRALLASVVGAVLVLGVAAPARAACTISTTPLSFGIYNVFATAPLDSIGTVTYRCTPIGLFVQISLDRGGAPTFNPRRMLKGTEVLNYNLYRDAARTTIWGDGTGGTQIYSVVVTPPARPVDVPVYGRVPALQDVTAGTYTNTIIATIQF
jgi:spore coat protein U-like protein